MSIFSAEHADRIQTKKITVVVLIIDFTLSNSLSVIPGWDIIQHSNWGEAPNLFTYTILFQMCIA